MRDYKIRKIIIGIGIVILSPILIPLLLVDAYSDKKEFRKTRLKH